MRDALNDCPKCGTPVVGGLHNHVPDTPGSHYMVHIVCPKPDRISPTPRWDHAGHPDVAIHCAIADLTVQVARIANVLEYQMNIDPRKFPDTSNEVIHPC